MADSTFDFEQVDFGASPDFGSGFDATSLSTDFIDPNADAFSGGDLTGAYDPTLDPLTGAPLDPTANDPSTDPLNSTAAPDGFDPTLTGSDLVQVNPGQYMTVDELRSYGLSDSDINTLIGLNGAPDFASQLAPDQSPDPPRTSSGSLASGGGGGGAPSLGSKPTSSGGSAVNPLQAPLQQAIGALQKFGSSLGALVSQALGRTSATTLPRSSSLAAVGAAGTAPLSGANVVLVVLIAAGLIFVLARRE